MDAFSSVGGPAAGAADSAAASAVSMASHRTGKSMGSAGVTIQPMGTAGRWDGTHELALCSAGGLAAAAAASAAAAAASMDSHITVKAMGRTGMGQEDIRDGKGGVMGWRFKWGGVEGRANRPLAQRVASQPSPPTPPWPGSER